MYSHGMEIGDRRLRKCRSAVGGEKSMVILEVEVSFTYRELDWDHDMDPGR